MTQLESAIKGQITREMRVVAEKELIAESQLMQLIAQGKVVIPANKNHSNLEPIGIGKSMRTKINANIGTSGDFKQMQDELKKLEIVVKYQADTVMDLSTGGDINQIRRELIKKSTIPFGNVPIYQMVMDMREDERAFVQMEVDEMMAFIEMQAQDGVDFMTIHAGLVMGAVEKIKNQGRRAGIVSRGGALITGWMMHNKRENPFYEHFDRILAIAKKYDVTLSLGDGLRPGSLADGTDMGQVQELITLGELVKQSRQAGVQVMVEGPGHLPIDQIEMNVKLQKTLCDDAPFYVLGPIVTDIAPGYDHITSAMGAAIAGAAGADYICYVTPAEHLALPDAEDVKNGVMAARIAAHVADIAKGIPGAIDRDNQMATARSELNWDRQQELCLDPEKFKQVRAERGSSSEACSMCGNLCVYKILKTL